jgi:membrane associated rhomboid family serine protease
MIFPVGDDQVHGGDTPWFSHILIALNTAVFLLMAYYVPHDRMEAFYRTFGAIPAELVQGHDLWTLLSSMFLHGGLVHLLGNMVFMYVFADNIEASIGSWRFILFYLAGGLVAAGTHVLLGTGSTLPMVGASGAISAVLGAYLIMFPASRIRVFILIFFRTATLPAFLFLGIWIAQQLVSGWGSLYEEGMASGGVAWWAHIGGFAFGVLAGFPLRNILRARQRGMLV